MLTHYTASLTVMTKTSTLYRKTVDVTGANGTEEGSGLWCWATGESRTTDHWEYIPVVHTELDKACKVYGQKVQGLSFGPRAETEREGEGKQGKRLGYSLILGRTSRNSHPQLGRGGPENQAMPLEPGSQSSGTQQESQRTREKRLQQVSPLSFGSGAVCVAPNPV